MLSLTPYLLSLLLYSAHAIPVDTPQTLGQTQNVSIVNPAQIPVNVVNATTTTPTDDTDYVKNLHTSTGIAVMLILAIAHYDLWYSGFKLGRSFFRSTDTLAWGLL